MGAFRMTLSERIARSSEASRASVARSITALQEMVASGKDEELARCRAGMIDGTHEIDEPPHGVAPRSNRDHAAWSRMQFQDLHGRGGYEPRRSRDFRHKTSLSDFGPTGGNR